LSCTFDSTNSLSQLLDRMPVDFQDDSGKTPLHYAAEHHSIRCIELLLKRRAKPDIKCNNGYIPLEIALKSQRYVSKIRSVFRGPFSKHLITAPTVIANDGTWKNILVDHSRYADKSIINTYSNGSY
jgi:hypothetical protein